MCIFVSMLSPIYICIPDIFVCYFSKDEKEQLRAEAEKLAKSIDLSAVRLCFQAFLPDENDKLTRSLAPVYSVPIYDQSKKSFSTLNHFSSCTSMLVSNILNIYYDSFLCF